MRFLIISHVEHIKEDSLIYAYAPYVREMNLWFKYVDEVEIIAPLVNRQVSKIDIAYQHKNILFNAISAIQFTSLFNSIGSFFKLPIIIFTIFRACQKADHIHLRCPGNIGLLGCFVQLFFPIKTKTAKYAGNWDPDAQQPLSYKLQKWILSNAFITRNIQVLVYGNWPNQSKNIKSFFTATFNNNDKENPQIRDYSNELHMVFTGSLVEGKRPLFAIEIIEALQKKGRKVFIDIFGDGILKQDLQRYITNNNLEDVVKLHGNKPLEVVKEYLKKAHFLILPSKSEGWPKAIAEAMFFGAIPVATNVSCISFMLDFGKRGILIKPNLNDAFAEIEKHLYDEEKLKSMSKLATNWSQNYTLETFETDIAKLLKN